MTLYHIIGVTLAGLVLGVIIGFWTRKKIVESQFDSIKNYSKKIINEAHRKAKNLKKEAILKAKDTLYQMKLDFENETKEKRAQVQAQERRLFHKEENLDKKISQYEQKEQKLTKRERGIEQIEGELNKSQLRYQELMERQRQELERVAGISSKEAKGLLILSMGGERSGRS
jgi:ribonuclease Y